MSNPVGRPADERRKEYIQRYGLKDRKHRLSDWLHTRLMDQLDKCKDEESRRILLGITHKM